MTGYLPILCAAPAVAAVVGVVAVPTETPGTIIGILAVTVTGLLGLLGFVLRTVMGRQTKILERIAENTSDCPKKK